MATSDAVIVIFLRGGADGLSLIPPIGDDDYYRTRPGLAIDERDAIPLDGLFGLHPRLASLESLYRDGHLAVIPAVGSNSDTRSHFEAQDIVEGGGEDVAGGWLGRWLRLAPRYFGPQARRLRSLICNEETASKLIEKIGPPLNP